VPLRTEGKSPAAYLSTPQNPDLTMKPFHVFSFVQLCFCFLGLSFSSLLSAQVQPMPYAQDFESFSVCATNCGTTCNLTDGWLNAADDQNRLDRGSGRDQYQCHRTLFGPTPRYDHGPLSLLRVFLSLLWGRRYRSPAFAASGPVGAGGLGHRLLVAHVGLRYGRTACRPEPGWGATPGPWTLCR
jgi:hypothetical protein